MADDVATPAEPVSTEAAAPSSPEPTKPDTFEVPSDPEAYTRWRFGKPQAESAPAKKTESKPKGDAEGDQDAPGDAAEPEPAPNKEQPSKAQKRLNELLEDLRKAGLSPSELKSFKREAKAAEAPPNGTSEKRPEKAPLVDESAPKKPKQDDFKTWEEYENARDKYFEDLADYKAQLAVESDRQRQRQETLQQQMTERLNDAKKRYGTEADTKIVGAAKAIFQDQAIPGAIREILNGSGALVDVLYAIGKDASDLEDFVEMCKRDPGAAVRKAVLVEKLVMEELAKAGGQAPTRDEDGKFVAAPEKKASAPPPPREVSGRSGAPKDAVQRAVETGDFDTYRAEQNRRDLARARGQ